MHLTGIGDRIREERSRLGLSQEAFGDIGGVKKFAQSNYERSKRHPDTAYLEKISRAGVDVLYVITGKRQTSENGPGLIDADFLAEIAERLDQIIQQAGKESRGGADYVRMVADVYNFLAQQGSRDAETTDRVLKLVVNR